MMGGTDEGLVSLSKFIAYVLRHNPSAANVVLDEGGWADVSALIDGINASGRHISRAILERIVLTDAKRRYSFNDDKTKIRANQGHSVAVNVCMKECSPLDVLYHGTAEKFLAGIKERGICKRSRMFVHLTDNIDAAFATGARHGKPIVLVIDSKRMAAEGYKFYLPANGVWQSADIPWEYVKQVITRISGGQG